MIFNLLATALVLAILGVVLLLIVYLTSLAILLFVPWTQAYLVFAHWLRLQNPARLLTPEAYTLTRKSPISILHGCFGGKLDSHALANQNPMVCLFKIAFTTRNIRISAPDGLRLGAWHILPKNTPRSILEQIRANEPFSPRPQTNEDAYTTSDKVNAATDTIFEDTLATADRVILYFHGQVGDRGTSTRIATYKGIQEAMPSAHIITIDCRGYGDSDGFPSEAGFKTDAIAAWAWLTRRVPCEKIVIYGHSLGSGIATNLCLHLEEQQFSPLALILDAAFTSMPDMMTAYRKIPIIQPFARFPFLLNHFKLRLMDRFETVRSVETIQSPLLLIHGDEDADVLISNSHTLFHTALTARRLQCNNKEMTVTEAGEAASAEEEMARAGLELTFQQSHSTGRDAGLLEQKLLQRSTLQQQDDELFDGDLKETGMVQESRPSSIGSDSGLGSEVTSGRNSHFVTSPTSPQHGPKEDLMSLKEGFEHTNEHGHGHGHGPCHTVQLDFPREGSLEYNQEYQIGFLTVQYAGHSNCMDYSIAKEVLGTFLTTAENWQQAQKPSLRRMDKEDDGMRTRTTMSQKEMRQRKERLMEQQDLAKMLCRDKIGFVDQSEVPEVVE
ncbi:Monoacylglycerol lipase abhd12 [Linnemannia exigua]|uniref:Monoacylglycerol lipase abhd12 n=1 Tax=Linnemannia exigua TaxID=604196 RepID=A0AAD4DL35_9FUNG|nr:Monoacylglycerol lipase abhd12 [Linnemannia exigua]